MQGLTAVFVQTEGQDTGAEAAPTSAVVSAPDHAPLFSGPAPALWAGAGTFLVVMLLGLILIIRGRVVAATPRTPKVKGETLTYFEPAGDDAEILFEEDEQPADQAPQEEQTDWRDNGAEVSIHHGGDRRHGDLHEDADDAPEVEPLFEAPQPEPEPKKKKSAFAGLFSKKKTPAPAIEAAPEPEPEEAAFVEEEAPADDGYYVDEPEPQEDESWFGQTSYAPAPAQPAPYNEADEARLRDAEAAASQALQRAEQAEAAAIEAQRAQAESERIFKLGMSNSQEALKETHENALKIMEQRLSTLSSEFETRLAKAAPPASAAAPEHHAGTEGHTEFSEEHFAEFANLMGEQFEALKTAVNDAIDRLSKRIDRLPAAAPGEGVTTAARVQLSDLLSDVLPPQRFHLGAKLPSGRTAEALVTMPGAIAPIAIEARFPVEAFDEWRASKGSTALAPAAETELRRIVLRHVADAAEKLIVAGATADCALMFIPSENILSEMHANFSDLVQESYRARVWMVGPTSLMATLHTISAVLSGAGAKPQQANEAELLELKTRLAALEAKGPAAAAQPPQPPQPAEKPTVAPATYTGLLGQSVQRTPPKPGDDKAPFPLR